MYHYFSPKNYCNAPKAKCFNVVVKLQVSKPARETSKNQFSQNPQKPESGGQCSVSVSVSVEVNTL